MDRSKFVSGEPKPPRPKCSTDGCVGSVYNKTIKHCDDCIAKFNKSIEASRPAVVTGFTSPELGRYVPQYSEQPPVVAWENPRPSEVISERVHIPIELPRPTNPDRDFDFE